ncbi:MAG: hypothetical protein GF411_10590 [Candidatus Lokiarchaeota archaeon]|nr:hypothetical protein [Candidatus Lokiarchaeota archaeon]
MDWRIDPEEMYTNAENTIETVRKQLDEIANTPEGEESQDTLLQFEEAFATVRETCGPIEFLKYVSTDKDRRDIYQVLVRLEPQKDSYDSEEKLLLERTLDEFRHRGAALEKEKEKGMEFLEIANNISVLQSEFNRVINEITTKVPVRPPNSCGYWKAKICTIWT